MKKTFLLITGFIAAFGLGYYLKPVTANASARDTNVLSAGFSANPASIENPKVTGISGIFFKCKDPKALKAWYKTHLGINADQYGARFEWPEGSMQWTPFSEKGAAGYFAPSTKEFMINYSVNNLVEMVSQLKKEGVTLADTIETYDYGKFIHIMDNEGNKIELWEPNKNYKPEQK